MGGVSEMAKVDFNFEQIEGIPTFYREFTHQFALGEEFGTNLNALWDAVTGDISLPVEIEFIHFSARGKRCFGEIILLFKEAQEELNSSLRFNVRESGDEFLYYRG